jgi:hypothetical protein
MSITERIDQARKALERKVLITDRSWFRSLPETLTVGGLGGDTHVGGYLLRGLGA